MKLRATLTSHVPSISQAPIQCATGRDNAHVDSDLIQTVTRPQPASRTNNIPPSPPPDKISPRSARALQGARGAFPQPLRCARRRTRLRTTICRYGDEVSERGRLDSTAAAAALFHCISPFPASSSSSQMLIAPGGQHTCSQLATVTVGMQTRCSGADQTFSRFTGVYKALRLGYEVLEEPSPNQPAGISRSNLTAK